MKPVPEFPGYFADELGNVYSTKRAPKFKRRGNHKYLRPQIQKMNGSLFRNTRIQIKLRKPDGTPVYKFRAVIILETFVGSRPSGSYACHGEYGALVDSLDNVYWGTPTQNNLQDRIRDNTLLVGSKNHRARLTENQVIEARQRYKFGGLTHGKIAEIYKIPKATMSKILRRETWKHV